jgi:hypothetical protein
LKPVQLPEDLIRKPSTHLRDLKLGKARGSTGATWWWMSTAAAEYHLNQPQRQVAAI